MSQQRSPYLTWLVGLFLVFYFVISVLSVLDKVSVYDEHPHILSGYSYLQTGKFTGGLDNPPLLQTLFVLPAWLLGAEYRPYVDENLIWFRIPAIVLGTLAGLLVFLWSKSLYGERAGLFSLVLYVFSTGCLGLARYAVLDFGAAFFFLLALFFADRVLEEQSSFRLVLAGLVCGLALCTKYTLLPLIVLVPLLAFLTPQDREEESWWHSWVNGLSWPFIRERLKLVIPFLIITFLIVNACFLFEGFLTQKTLEPQLQMELAQEQISTLSILGRFVPTSFHSGLAGKLKQAKRGREAFLWGSRWKGGTIVVLPCLPLSEDNTRLSTLHFVVTNVVVNEINFVGTSRSENMAARGVVVRLFIRFLSRKHWTSPCHFRSASPAYFNGKPFCLVRGFVAKESSLDLPGAYPLSLCPLWNECLSPLLRVFHMYCRWS